MNMSHHISLYELQNTFKWFNRKKKKNNISDVKRNSLESDTLFVSSSKLQRIYANQRSCNHSLQFNETWRVWFFFSMSLLFDSNTKLQMFRTAGVNLRTTHWNWIKKSFAIRVKINAVKKSNRQSYLWFYETFFFFLFRNLFRNFSGTPHHYRPSMQFT